MTLAFNYTQFIEVRLKMLITCLFLIYFDVNEVDRNSLTFFRSYFFDRVYESIITCLGCERCARGKTGFISAFEELRAVDATYEGFSARRAKAALDEKIAWTKRQRLKEKLRFKKNKRPEVKFQAVSSKKQDKTLVEVEDKARRKSTKGTKATRPIISSPVKVESSEPKSKRSSTTPSSTSKSLLETKSKTPERESRRSSKSPRGKSQKSKSRSPENKSMRSPTTSSGKKSEKEKTSSPARTDKDVEKENVPETKSAKRKSKREKSSAAPQNRISDETTKQKLVSSDNQSNFTDVTPMGSGVPIKQSASENEHVNAIIDVEEEPLYENLEATNKSRMGRRESIQTGVKDMEGHMFNQTAGGAAAALMAAIVDDDEEVAESVESLSYDFSDIEEALGENANVMEEPKMKLELKTSDESVEKGSKDLESASSMVMDDTNLDLIDLSEGTNENSE